MLVNMLVRGGIMVAGLVATNAVLEKVERSVLKRMNDKKVKSEDEEEVEKTEEELKQAFDKLDKLADEFEEEIKYRGL